MIMNIVEMVKDTMMMICVYIKYTNPSGLTADWVEKCENSLKTKVKKPLRLTAVN